MNTKEIRAVAKVMKDFGIVHFKSAAFELSAAAPAETRVIEAKEDVAPKKRGRRRKLQALPPEAKEEIQHRTEEMASLLKLGDEDLVNRLFPEPTADEEEIA